MKNTDTGLLLNDQNIKLHRQWFKQMTSLLGINVLYQAPKDSQDNSKTYNMYGELNPDYEPAIRVGCIFDEHPTQKTMRKLGWNAEMAETSTVIHAPYDLKNLQAGARFIIPPGIDSAEPRVFKVLRMSNIAIYPASISCELGPVLESTLPKEKVEDFSIPQGSSYYTTFNLLGDESDEYGH